MGDFRQFSLGARINYQELLFFSVGAKSEPDRFSPRQVGIGAEYISPYYFGVKGGYRIMTDGSGLSNWSAGLSVNAPKVALHYAVVFAQLPGQEAEHAFGATFLF